MGASHRHRRLVAPMGDQLDRGQRRVRSATTGAALGGAPMAHPTALVAALPRPERRAGPVRLPAELGLLLGGTPVPLTLPQQHALAASGMEPVQTRGMASKI